MKRILLVLSSLVLVSCTTLNNNGGLNDFYKSNFTENDILPTECLLAEGEEPKIYYSENLDNDIIFLKSNYYQILGYSTFNGPAQGDELSKNVMALCKEKRAKIALYNYSYTDTRHGVVTSTYGYYPYEIKRYDYTIVLFITLSHDYIENQKTGFEVKDLDTSTRQTLQRNTGVVIDVIYDESPAFYANLIKNDVFININGVDVYTSDDYYNFINKYNGKTFVLTIIRNGVEKKISY